MSDMIRINPETFMWISKEFIRLADQMEELEAALRRLQYHLSDDALQQIFEELAALRRKLDIQEDKATLLARRVLIILDDFMRCERRFVVKAEAFEAEMNYQFARLSRGGPPSETEK